MLLNMFHGKIHYFDWAIFNCKLLVHQRVFFQTQTSPPRIQYPHRWFSIASNEKKGPERGGWDELVVKIAILMDMVGEEGWLVENLGCLFP